MPLSTVTLPAGVNAAGPAVAFVSGNTRARSQASFLGLQTDVVQFAGPMVTGTWITAGARVFVQHIPVVLQSSTGIAVQPLATAPMAVVMGDTRVMGT